MVKHVVLFKFKPETTQAQRQALADALNALPPLISEIKGWSVVWSMPGRSPRLSHLALFSEFDSVAALDRYIAHPEHQKILPLVEAVSESRANFDYE
jgi:hypothetical protein